MTRAGFGLRSMLVAGTVLTLGSLAGCGDSGSSGQSVSASQGVIDRSPTTSTGSGQTTVGGVPTGTAGSGQSSSGSSSTVTLSWDAPTENSDGSALMDLKGYKVHYGSASKSYSDTIQVANPGLTTYVVQNLPAGQYYFAITAYNASGDESTLSGEVSTQVN